MTSINKKSVDAGRMEACGIGQVAMFELTINKVE